METFLRVAVALGLTACGSISTGDPGGSTDGGGSSSSPDAGVTAPPSGDRDPTGFGDTVFANGPDPANPFFLALGTNGRSCATCHVQATGWTITPATVQARLAASPADPLFRAVDGANSPTADLTNPQAAFSMLLHRAVIRIGLPVPAGAEFTLTTADDPYHYASAAELSLFRRPLPSTNLRFLSSTMWDGREPSLAQQAVDATLGHAQGTTTDPDQIAAIVAFESSLSTAQSFDDGAGALDAAGAQGGPVVLATATFTPGETDPDVFALYTNWAGNQRRQSIARGQRVFETRPITITGVAGLNDQPGQATIHGTCSTCHDTASAGDHSVTLLLDLGLTIPQRRTPDLPLYTFTRTADGATVQTTDPGLALSTGKWTDMSKFKVPVLRALAMRAPYFHDGSAPDLPAVVGFYDQRFHLGLSPQDRGDLVAFLQSL
jgi:cytochrome c peroxidase